MVSKLILGARGSKLALFQAEKVRRSLLGIRPELAVEIKIVKTTGDLQPQLNLLEAWGKGIFCAELERALLAGEIDLAVHSVKDLPGELPRGLVLGAYLEREDPREVLVSRHNLTLEQLPEGALVGTSSVRRLYQLKAMRKDLRFAPIRGNVETRVEKVREGLYDATVLALAGLKRLNLIDCITEYFPVERLIPAVGQGCIGVEVRSDATELLELLAAITHPDTAAAVRAERSFLKIMGGDCQRAVAAYAESQGGGRLKITGLVARNEEDMTVLDLTGTAEKPEELGAELARKFLGGRAAGVRRLCLFSRRGAG